MKREDFKKPVVDAIRLNGGRATIVQIAKYIWDNYETDIRAAGDVLYTWQYEMRWAGQALVDEGKISKTGRGVGVWHFPS
ncbi:hypothetical protein [Methylopila turkensis]|uniref:Uncharacterized protein n=1 Tax=Methylopila turkensis TaxID=1437816 RepID=A0A9W6JR38_9HYPH|nr:hypothetical protein [Methylopila turkensis]GLK81722.1 hypothetical protein GCM10008174_34630 [Methylopila turkensis]